MCVCVCVCVRVCMCVHVQQSLLKSGTINKQDIFCCCPEHVFVFFTTPDTMCHVYFYAYRVIHSNVLFPGSSSTRAVARQRRSTIG